MNMIEMIAVARDELTRAVAAGQVDFKLDVNGMPEMIQGTGIHDHVDADD